VGPRSGYVAAIIGLTVGVGVGLVAVLLHPRTRVLTRRGVEATATATAAAAGSAREHLKARTDSLRAPRDQDSQTETERPDEPRDLPSDGAGIS
ncbi:beta-carotene 15,15'-monooxygenase, partial [Actinomyces sp. MRS3W]|nr:beta-carotene 15,15'-monooxygenase [Actinomyces sp. MRS3W]